MAMNNMMTRISPTIGTTFVDSNFVAVSINDLSIFKFSDF